MHCWLALILWLQFGIAHGEDTELKLLAPGNQEAWVGETIRFSLEIAVLGQFAGPTVFDLPEIPAAILMQSGDRPVIGSRSNADGDWTTQQHEFFLYAQQGGSLEIPPLTARFGLRERFDAPQQQRQLLSQAFKVEIQSPPGVEPGTIIAAASGLELQEIWEPANVSELEQGDSVKRIIKTRAANYPAMLLPHADFAPSGLAEGIASYPDQPFMDDRVDRGDWQAARSDSVVYVFEQAGEFQLPDIQLRWWDPEAEQWQEQSFPSRTFAVTSTGLAGRDGEGGSENGQAFISARILKVAGSLLLVLLLLALGSWLVRDRVSAWLRDWQQREAAQMRDLLGIVKDRPAAAVYSACREYVQKQATQQPSFDDAEIQKQLIQVQEVMIGARADFDRPALGLAIRQTQKSTKDKAKKQQLPAALNPMI
jgi:hypothetical protein